MKPPTAQQRKAWDAIASIGCLVCGAAGLRTWRESAIKDGPETLRQQRPALTTNAKDRAMAAKPLPSQDVLRQLLSYTPETGALHWRANDVAPKTNARKPGGLAFRCKTDKGYFRGGLLGRNVMAHRVVWKWHYGTEPAEIDHIDGNPSNNVIGNLRAASRQDNVRNTRIRKTNKSGVQGVHLHRGYWVASIRNGGKQIELGQFKTVAEAATCRKQAEQEFGYHANHGRAVNG